MVAMGTRGCGRAPVPAIHASSASRMRLKVKTFIVSALLRSGLSGTTDFKATATRLLVFRGKDVANRLVTMLREAFPMFVFHWESSRCLVWF